MHTAAPGSPFCNVGEKPSKEEIKQAAIICAHYSQDWRNNQKDIIVHQFIKSDTYKKPGMAEGPWGVKRQEKIKIKKIDILNLMEKNESD